MCEYVHLTKPRTFHPQPRAGISSGPSRSQTAKRKKDFREVSCSLFKVGTLWDMFGILIHSLKMACDPEPLTGSSPSLSPFLFPSGSLKWLPCLWFHWHPHVPRRRAFTSLFNLPPRTVGNAAVIEVWIELREQMKTDCRLYENLSARRLRRGWQSFRD